MRLLVTGGCGFLGSNLAAEALRRGHEVTVFDNLARLGAAENLRWLQGLNTFRFINGDIRDAGAVGQAVATAMPEAVFHLAGQVAMTTSLADPRLDMEINIGGTFNLLEAIRRHAPEAAIVYSSTNKVYGGLDQYEHVEEPARYRVPAFPNGFDEATPLSFQSPYGCSKGAADQYMLDFAHVYGLKTVVFRHSSIYGGRQYSTFDQGWVGWFCTQALLAKEGRLDKPFTIAGNGKQVRDVLHADDVKNLYFAALDNIGHAAGNAFNVGGGMDNSLSLVELFALLEDLCEVRLTYECLPPRLSDQRVFVADLSKAKRLLGWSPHVSARAGVTDMLGWTKEILKGNAP